MNVPTVYINATNCITPLGFDVKSNVRNISGGISGIKFHEDKQLLQDNFYAALIDTPQINEAFKALTNEPGYTRLEKMMILALHPVISGRAITGRSVLILSTTKGNIAGLSNDPLPEGVYLSRLAQNIADFFGFMTEPVVVSNACVSGIMAVSVAKRLIQANLYDEAYMISGDEVSSFVLSGFSSFQAMSNVPCKPYSKDRSGVTLGEAAAAVLITKDSKEGIAKVIGDASINDANHISGPSRTGEGLVRSISAAMKEAGVKPEDIDYISAHGTATVFNDEMEAIAFNRTGLEQVPLNSFKGYYGHTLGASGLLEAIIAIESMRGGKLFTSHGYEEHGVSQPINVIKENTDKPIKYFLKTASGFGGCNSAVVFENVSDGK